MATITRWLSSLWNAHAFDRQRREQELKEELAFHFREEVDRRVAAGQSAADALTSAKRDFGNVPLVQEITREMWGWSIHDYKLGLRMLVKYPGLTIAGGLALAIAIGIGAGWYDLSHQILRPAIPLPDGARLVEVDVFNSLANESEPRLLHDVVTWWHDPQSIEDLGVYRTIERSVAPIKAHAEPVTMAETTASAFRIARLPPLLGRTLIEADEKSGAPGVIVLGHRVWQRQFGGRPDIVGQDVQLGRSTATVVGVMPEGFAFPVNHQAWIPLQLRASGYAPLEGGAIHVFGRLAPGVDHRAAAAELATRLARAAAVSPESHRYLRPTVRPYGGVAIGVRLVEHAATHVPILLVLIVACATVGTLVHARTATRNAEIAVRSALGASRRRIVVQLFVEALVLAAIAGAVGLTAAHFALKWGIGVAYSGGSGGPPFWIHSGLALSTLVYAAGLAVTGAALLGALPALKATGSDVQSHLRNLGSGGTTLRFGRVWTTAMIGQVALTVMLLPPVMGGSWEAVRDRIIRARFPASQYLVVPIELDRGSGLIEESDSAFADRMERTYQVFEQRIGQEPGVLAVAFADRLPGMAASVRTAQAEPSPGAAPTPTRNLWTSSVGPGFFDLFDRPIIAGRDFHARDRAAGAQTVIVNEAFARDFTNGSNPVGARMRYASDDDSPDTPYGPWFEVVGVARDIGMTPTDPGEAPYVFHPASPGLVQPLVMGVRARGEAGSLLPRVHAIAADLDPDLHLGDVRTLDDVARSEEVPALVAAGSVVSIVGLGLFLSASGIFSLMSVTVSRRMREIGLRAALGASRFRLLRDVFSGAALLVGSGIAVGNLVLALAIVLAADSVTWTFVAQALATASAIMMTAGMLACIAPARRALRIHTTDALKDT